MSLKKSFHLYQRFPYQVKSHNDQVLQRSFTAPLVHNIYLLVSLFLTSSSCWIESYSLVPLASHPDSWGCQEDHQGAEGLHIATLSAAASWATKLKHGSNRWPARGGGKSGNEGLITMCEEAWKVEEEEKENRYEWTRREVMSEVWRNDHAQWVGNVE